MASAKPLPAPRMRAAATAAPGRGTPLRVPGAAPARSSDGSTFFAGQIPFSSFEIQNPTDPPFITHGIMFFRQRGFTLACSATVVDTPSKSVVWTAAHCVHEGGPGGTFSTDVIFLPGYEEQAAPFGAWAAQRLAAPIQWTRDSDPRFDFAAMVMTPSPAHGNIADAVGSRGIAFNLSKTQDVQSFGYPAEPFPPFDGQHQHSCVSTTDGRLVEGFVAMGCDMRQGSSGGGWIIEGQFVNSNVSFGDPNQFPDVAFGPYFGVEAQSLYEQIGGDVSGPPPPDPVRHRVVLGLNLRRHLVAKGRMTIADGFTECAADAPVQILRIRDNVARHVKTVRTSETGRYRTKLRDRKGRYVAVTDEAQLDASNICRRDVSPIRRHRH